MMGITSPRTPRHLTAPIHAAGHAGFPGPVPMPSVAVKRQRKLALGPCHTIAIVIDVFARARESPHDSYGFVLCADDGSELDLSPSDSSSK